MNTNTKKVYFLPSCHIPKDLYRSSSEFQRSPCRCPSDKMCDECKEERKWNELRSNEIRELDSLVKLLELLGLLEMFDSLYLLDSLDSPAELSEFNQRTANTYTNTNSNSSVEKDSDYWNGLADPLEDLFEDLFEDDPDDKDVPLLEWSDDDDYDSEEEPSVGTPSTPPLDPKKPIPS